MKRSEYGISRVKGLHRDKPPAWNMGFLLILVFDHDHVGCDEFIGGCSFSTKELETAAVDGWFKEWTFKIYRLNRSINNTL